MKTLHLILNAHIDPVWLWPWQAGLGEVIATCRSACDRLDANPDIWFTRGESWAYEQIERTDPHLFARIRAHVAAGRWEIIGGWYLQPDCNLPSAWAMEKQIALGQAYFRDRFGVVPRTAYNVDSFGHAAALPGLMAAAGQNRYVITRPSQQELPLPARFFRWRGYADGPEVTVARAYWTNSHELTTDALAEAITNLPAGCEHSLCGVGVGDHGGGPTEHQLAWLRQHADGIPGWTMQFSTLDRFFAAIKPLHERLPLHVGELQYHAVGCYSVHRPVKTALRRCEHLLAQAGTLPGLDASTTASLDQGWKRVCFHHFHDTLAGACTPTAYIAVHDQLGGAAAAADEALRYHLQRRIADLPADPLQRIVVLNASDKPFDDWMEHEPYVGPWFNRWVGDCHLIDETGQPLPAQLLDAESLSGFKRDDSIYPRLLFRLALKPGEMKVLRISREPGAPRQPSSVSGAGDRIASTHGAACRPDLLTWTADHGPAHQQPVRLDLLRDLSDTWSHGIDRYDEQALANATWDDPVVVDNGPLMAALVCTGRVGDSHLRAEWRTHAGSRWIDLRLRVHWREHFRMLKLTLPFRFRSGGRTDGVMGTSLARANDGGERPLRDWTRLDRADGGQFAVVCPDVYGIDATAERVRLTLLRSPSMAQHDPSPRSGPRGEPSDQGVHMFRFRFLMADAIDDHELDRIAFAIQRPPVVADTTKGMPTVC